MGFYGEYKCASDAKGRFFVPAKLRDAFGEDRGLMLVKSLDACVSIYPSEVWHAFEEKINALPLTDSRDIRRFFFGSAQEAEMDAQGRLQLPQILREYAGITKAITAIGCGDHVEIWDEASYLDYQSVSRTAKVEELLRRNGL